MKINILRSAPALLGALWGLSLAGCATDSGTGSVSAIPVPAGETQGTGSGVTQTEDALGVPITGAYNSTTKILTVDMNHGPAYAVGSPDPVPSVVIAVVNGALTVNGFNLALGTGGAALKPADIKGLMIVGTGADGDKVVLDTLNGALGPSGLTYSASAFLTGISIDLQGHPGVVSLRGSTGVDAWKAAQNGDDVFFEITGDKKPDVVVEGTSGVAISYTVALAGGNDTFTAGAFGPLSPAVTGLTPLLDAVTNKATTFVPLASPISVYGGDGNDTLQGGLDDDFLYGGAGVDTFKSSTAIELTKVSAADDGADSYWGGAGLDKMDFTGRTSPVIVTLDGDSTTDDLNGGTVGGTDSDADGDGDEGDLFGDDIEDITGGDGDDTLTGNALGNKIGGGKGNDMLVMGTKGTCTAPSSASDPPADVDAYDGGDGDDTFDRIDAAGCGDTLTGGAGTDTVDYSARTADIQISLAGTAISGEVADASIATPVVVEKDVLKADIEDALGSTANKNRFVGSASANNFTGGDLADYLDGAAGDDTLDGGLGDDTIVGNAGNDTITGGDDDDTITGADGNDTIDGGVGNDSIDGGAGNDALTGGDDDDLLSGGVGNDTLDGGDGNDYLNGDAGDDVFDEGAAANGDDVVNGGAGFDKLSYASRTADLVVTMCNSTVLSNSSTTVPAGDCATADDGDTGNSEADNVINIDHFVGGDGADDVTGTSADDIIEGGAGGDTLTGGLGADKLYGDDDDDTITGDEGEDHLEGGVGDDALDGGDGEDDCLTDASDTTAPAVSCEL